MSKPKSFRPSDFSLRDIPGFFAAYLVIAAVSVGLGLAIEAIPDFWGGVLAGVGLACFAAMLLLRPKTNRSVCPELCRHPAQQDAALNDRCL